MILSNKKINRIIRESVYKFLNETYLLEYAIKRKEFIQNVRDIVFELIENWCLIHYCTLTFDKLECKEHWKREFRTHMSKIIRTKLKDYDDNLKLKAIREAFNDMDLYVSSDIIYEIIMDKFNKENIELDKFVKLVCYDCFKSIDTIAQIASIRNGFKELDEYIESI